jgi:hypothetical protein
MESLNPANVAIPALPAITAAIIAPQLTLIGTARQQIKPVTSAVTELLRHLKYVTTRRRLLTTVMVVVATAASSKRIGSVRRLDNLARNAGTDS